MIVYVKYKVLRVCRRLIFNSDVVYSKSVCAKVSVFHLWSLVLTLTDPRTAAEKGVITCVGFLRG